MRLQLTITVDVAKDYEDTVNDLSALELVTDHLHEALELVDSDVKEVKKGVN